MKIMKGLVIKTTGSWHLVEVENNKTIKCKIKGNLRQKEIKTTNPVAVYDIVEISPYSEDECMDYKYITKKKLYNQKSK